MTPSERNALLFLSALLLLGVSVRLVRARSAEVHPTPQEQAALTAQLAAVDSVRTAAKSRRRGTGSSARSRTAAAAGASGTKKRAEPSVPPSDPPLRPATSSPPIPESRLPSPDPVDLDLAPLLVIEALPWIGPVLAARIVADRDSLGPFGSMEGFQRVKGVGPGMAARLAGRVTFSQTPRHLRVEDRGSRAPIRARHQPPVRPYAP